MGYYVNGYTNNFKIKKENFEKGYQLLCELNKHDDLKSGGSFGGNRELAPKTSQSLAKYQDRWFGFMSWNYDEECNDLEDILQEVGFEVDFDENNDIWGLTFDKKSADEELFLNALAPVIEDNSTMNWSGEDPEDLWRDIFKNGKMIRQTGYIKYK